MYHYRIIRILVKILIVDDSKIMRKQVMRAIRQAGFDEPLFLEAENGQQAFDYIKQEPPDLLITDLNMPVMGGLELLQKIKSESITLKSGVISSQCTDEMLSRTKKAGALFLIGKPFTPDKLKTAISDVL